MILNFRWENDEVCEITLDGNPIITTNHDEHGWDGMEAVQTALTRCAKFAKWEIHTDGEAGI